MDPHRLEGGTTTGGTHETTCTVKKSCNLENWQYAIDEILEKAKSSCILETFSLLSNNTARIEFIIGHESMHMTVTNSEQFKVRIKWIEKFFECNIDSSDKCFEKACLHRTIGNDHFSHRNFKTAIAEYTQSILLAPVEGECLALAYGNRSAALYHSKDYTSCIDDIDEALHCHYPSHASYKLHYRKAQSLHRLRKFSQASDCYHHALGFIDVQSCDDKKKDDQRADIVQQLEKIALQKQSGTTPDSSTITASVYGGPNPTLPSASIALSLKHAADKGRHILTKEDINIGDCLMVEEPYASVLLPDYYSVRCHHCCALRAAYPCPRCTRVLFCSVSCRSQATYHLYECHYLPLLHSIGIAHLSLRLLLTAGVKHVLEFLAELSSCPHRIQADAGGISGVNTNGVYSSKEYLSVYSLLTHEEKTLPDDLFQYSLTAVLLMRVLEESGAIKLESAPRATNHEDFASIVEWIVDSTVVTMEQFMQLGGILLRYLNGYFQDSLASCFLMSGSLLVVISRYLSFSLFSFVNNTLIVKATKQIKTGEDVFNCYGPDYRRMGTSERKRILRDQYFFECTCYHCKTQPLYTISQALRCKSCNGPVLPTTNDALPDISTKFVCSDCSHVLETIETIEQFVQLNNSQPQFIEAQHLETAGCIREAITKLEKCYAVQVSVLYKHNKQLAKTQDWLAKLHASTGNYKKSLSLLEKQFSTTQKIFGEDSIEVAHELQKMAEIAFNDMNINQALLMIDRAMAIYTQHYEPSHINVKDLVKMKKCLVRVQASMIQST